MWSLGVKFHAPQENVEPVEEGDECGGACFFIFCRTGVNAPILNLQIYLEKVTDCIVDKLMTPRLGLILC